MSNTFGWIPQLREGAVVSAPFANVPVATIDLDDVAGRGAPRSSNEHEGRAYRLSGPETLLPEDRVAALGRVLDRDLHLQPLSNEVLARSFAEPCRCSTTKAFMSFFAYGELDESDVLPTVEDLTGSPPRTFEEWARAHARAFPASTFPTSLYTRAMSSIPS